MEMDDFARKSLPELAPSVQPKMVCSVIRFDRQYVSRNPKEERSKRTQDSILDFSVVDTPVATFKPIIEDLERSAT